ncbi:MAG: helix-turn-helix domain-containing protein [Polyangia bacterium]
MQAAQYLSISRQTLYRLIGRGDLVPDGKVGSRLRFSVNHLDQFLQGATLNPSVDTRPERSSHAHTKTEAEVCRAGNQERWPQPVPGASRLERRQNGPEKECTESLQHNGRGSGVQGKARTGHKKPARTDTVLRLRRAMGLH